jgi:hypothetical protein
VGDHTYRWCDVVAFARACGEWEALTLAAGRRAQRLASEPAPPAAAVDRAVDEAAVAFRRERQLLAADELRAWLERWDLRIEDWLGYLRGSVLGDTLRGPVVAPVPGPAADPRLTWTEAVCSGALQVLAVRLATGLAARAGVGRPPVEPGEVSDPAIGLMLAADAEQFAAGHAGDAQLEVDVYNHRLDWTLVCCELVVHGREEVLREVAMCVRHDGLSLREAAARAGLTTTPVWSRVAEVDPALRGHLAATGVGELLGPVTVPGGVLLAQVIDRVAPDLHDPDTRAFATAHAGQQALAVAVTERARWHDHL